MQNVSIEIMENKQLSNSKSIHLRSSSMPEAVYIAKQQQAQALQAAFKPRVRHPSGHQTTHSKFIQFFFFLEFSF